MSTLFAKKFVKKKLKVRRYTVNIEKLLGNWLGGSLFVARGFPRHGWAGMVHIQ